MASCSQRCRRTLLSIFHALKLSRCLCLHLSQTFISCSEVKLLTDVQCPLMQNSSSAWLVCWLSKYFFKCTSVFIFPGPENPCCLSELSVPGWGFHCMLHCSVVTGLLINFGLLMYIFFAFLKENSDLRILKEMI